MSMLSVYIVIAVLAIGVGLLVLALVKQRTVANPWFKSGTYCWSIWNIALIIVVVWVVVMLQDTTSSYSALKSELNASRSSLSNATSQLSSVQRELNLLKDTREINFGNGLRVFDIDKIDTTLTYIKGKIQNVSNSPMKKVVVVVAFYDMNGNLEISSYLSQQIISDLFPQEVADWRISPPLLGTGRQFSVYAIGNKN